MKYRVTCLSPSLVGDGQKLAPIDYMVWKEHVNVLDQRRIFRLLARGPRLDGYLAQLKKADRLDFASWGGFAQNFAGRRIPFEHSSSIPVWERAPAQNLFIPTFACSPSGPYLPATAIKGALRTGSVFDRWTENTMRDVAARMEEDRPPRHPAGRAEDAVLGGSGSNRMRRVAAADSVPIPHAGMKVYLLRTSTLVARGGKYELGWKSARGTSEGKRIDDSTPVFAEMCPPGTAFEGSWREKSHGDRQKMFAASNRYAASQLTRHKQYAESCGLDRLAASLAGLEAKLAAVAENPGNACLLALGWGAGMLSKIASPDSDGPTVRSILKHFPLYERAVQTGLPFPKTRRIVFEDGQPSNLPGWVLLEVF
jgi:CRISPR-associated protein Csm5